MYIFFTKNYAKTCQLNFSSGWKPLSHKQRLMYNQYKGAVQKFKVVIFFSIFCKVWLYPIFLFQNLAIMYFKTQQLISIKRRTCLLRFINLFLPWQLLDFSYEKFSIYFATAHLRKNRCGKSMCVILCISAILTLFNKNSW